MIIGHLPSLTRDDAHFLTVSMQGDTAGLPPLIIGGVDDMEDVSVPEAEPLAGEPTVLRLFIVKQCSKKRKIQIIVLQNLNKRKPEYAWISLNFLTDFM